MGYRYQVVITALALGAIVSCDSTPISKIENTEPQIGITVVANKESYGCNSGASSLTKSGNYKLTYEGIERSYRLHLPRSYQSTSAYPLVMLFHGWGGDQNDFLQDKALIREADERGYILVAPTGLGSGEPDFAPNAWSFSGSTSGLDGDGGTGISGAICDYTATKNYNYTSCSDTAQNTCAWTHCQQDDIGFTLALVAHVGNEVCVNTSNVFASGASNGGMFAWELAQNTRSASTFRAIAPVIGLPHRGYTRAQGKNETLPAILISGNLDATVPPGDWGDENFTTT
ncbi:MAG: hypothetical protein CMP86_10370, partial [Gammaproteobacteria bacterium]|nr:hypothetical protein [Gammaproteobacteria bacterium]